MSSEPNLIFFNNFGDDRGNLVSLESLKNIPFDIKRIYYIYGTKSLVSRGKHAHKKLKQIRICVSGKVDVYCEYKGKKQMFHLDNPSEGLFLDGAVWHEMENFSQDSVLIVLADDFYDESDYIRNYQDFLEYK